MTTFECQEGLWVVPLMVSGANTGLGSCKDLNGRSTERKDKLTCQVLLIQYECNKFLSHANSTKCSFFCLSLYYNLLYQIYSQIVVVFASVAHGS